MKEKHDEFIAIETPIGWIAGKIKERNADDEGYILEMGDGQLWEVLDCEIFEGKDGMRSVAWW